MTSHVSSSDLLPFELPPIEFSTHSPIKFILNLYCTIIYIWLLVTSCVRVLLAVLWLNLGLKKSLKAPSVRQPAVHSTPSLSLLLT